ncbi:MAG: MMPL family transporter [Bacteroidia bacterium]|nr:MMPL family transporter [Bacteroidia bacterium]
MLYKFRAWIIVFFLLLSGASGFFMSSLKFHLSMEDFIPKGDQEINYYKEFKKKFTYGNAAILAAIQNDPDIFEQDFLQRVKSFEKSCQKLPHIADVTSLTTLKNPIYDPIMPSTMRVLHWNNPSKYAADSLALMQDPRMVDNYVSRDARTLCVVISVDSGLGPAQRDSLIASLYALGDQAEFDHLAFAGGPVAESTVVGASQNDFKFFIVLSSLLLLLAMIILFRRWAGILVSFLSVIIGLILFFGFLGAIGRPLDMLATLYPIMLAIVGTSDIVHIMTKYTTELGKGLSRKEAILNTRREIGMATFMTSLTTAIGFLSLYASNLPAVKTFGLLTAFGVFMAYATVILFSTALLTFFRADQLFYQKQNGNGHKRSLEKLYQFTKNQTRPVLLATGIVMLISIWGISTISFNAKEDRDIPRDSRLFRDYQFIDSTLHGISTMDLALETVPPLQVDDLEFLREVDKLNDFLRKQPELGTIYSPLMVFKSANRAWNANSVSQYKLPDSTRIFEQQREYIWSKFAWLAQSVISADKMTGKLSVKVQDIGTEKTKVLNQLADQWMAENLDPQKIRVFHTGSKYIIATNQDRLVASLLKSLGIALVLVSLFMALIFRNLKLIFISLIPNLVPLVIAAALVGFLGFELDAKIAMIFTIAFGIAVDDTIHFLSKFKLERSAGASVDLALKNTFLESGHAIVVTTLILFAGFMALTFSSFPPTFVIGLLIALTLLTAVVADMLLLPVLIRVLMKD